MTSLVLILLFCQHFGLAHSPLWTKVPNFIQIRKTRLIKVVVDEGGDVVDCLTQLTIVIMVFYLYSSPVHVFQDKRNDTNLLMMEMVILF